MLLNLIDGRRLEDLEETYQPIFLKGAHEHTMQLHPSNGSTPRSVPKSSSGNRPSPRSRKAAVIKEVLHRNPVTPLGLFPPLDSIRHEASFDTCTPNGTRKSVDG